MEALTLDKAVKGLDEKKIDFARMDKEVTIDLELVYERPPLAISIGSNNGYRNPFGTFGNISLIKGEEKARKSFLKSLILASAIGLKDPETAPEIQGHDLRDKWILDLDGEQDEYYTWLNGIRIPKLVGALPDNYQVKKLREKTPKERNQYLEWIFKESEYRNNIGLVSIDGYVDFVKNFNDQDESSEFTQQIMKYSSEAKCHIMGILHLNPGTTKARGHLGTILQQKCESVVTIQDGGDFSIVHCQRARGNKFDDFTLRVDNDWLPYVSDDPTETTTAKDPFS
jgi:hypothetical protein